MKKMDLLSVGCIAYIVDSLNFIIKFLKKKMCGKLSNWNIGRNNIFGLQEKKNWHDFKGTHFITPHMQSIIIIVLCTSVTDRANNEY